MDVYLGNGIIKARYPATAITRRPLRHKDLPSRQRRVLIKPIFSITIDEKGDLLFCNRGRGMYHLKNDSSALFRWWEIPTNAIYDVFDAIKSDSILCLAPETVCSRWIKTGRNISSVRSMDSPTTPSTRRYATNDGKIWPTNDGLIRYNPENDET